MIIKKVFIFAATTVAAFILIISVVCGVGDNISIVVFNKFCNSININIDGERWILGKIYCHLNPLNKIKEVVVGKRGSFKASAKVNYITKEVLQIENYETRNKIFNKYNISLDNRKIRNWPDLLSEQQAKQIAFIYAQQIGLPLDVKFSHMSLDMAYTGTWIAHWIRMHNGYQYENDFLTINIMAVNGEFYSYGKYYKGNPCKTEIKISKVDAIKISRDKVNSLINGNKTDLDVTKYIATSPELKIIQPNVMIGAFMPLHYSNSRLAWIITYILPSNQDMHLVESGDFTEKIVIKVDAASGRIIGGNFSK
ncbi:hypothetical protein [Trichlorobacter lovleyi]|uniref:hypothetical protein n=1 Tax=Trichlorobacter lovleyi TaxID=313985 RepID=UPI0024817E62|nr:hypothetical protein [Trichlorobacter lovleyi]